MADASARRMSYGAIPWIGALFFVSGAAGLVYEVLWFRLLLLRLGGTGLSVATVTAAFMAGLGLGAWLFGTKLAVRVPPLRLYGILEAAIGVYALLVPWLIRAAGAADVALLGAEPGAAGRVLRFFIAGAVLVPPTLCMGGTLPILSRLVEASDARPGRFVGLLYGLNTTGAVLGAGAAGFLLMPAMGLRATMILAAAVNLVLAAAALVLSRRSEIGAPQEPPPLAGEAAREAVPRPGLALLAAGASGLASFVLQVAWTRILALTFGSSVYAFSLILVLFLLGLGAGALAGSWGAGRTARAGRPLAWCFLAAGATVLAGQAGYSFLPRLYLDALASAGGRAAMGGAAWMAAAIMIPPTLLLGAAFPFVVRLATGDRRAGAAAGVGRIYAANTAGGVLGAYISALFLVPAFGLSGAVTLAAMLLLAVASVVAFMERDALSGSPARRLAPAGAVLLCVALWAGLVPSWDRNLMSMGVGLWGPHAVARGRSVESDLASLLSDRVLYYRDGVTATVAVKEAGPSASRPGRRYLTVDGHIEASDGTDMTTQVLLGQVPVLASRKRNPDVLVVGYASGVTVGSILTHDVASVTTLEIEGAVMTAGGFFDDVNGRPLRDPRVRIVIDDARAFLERTDRRYDVIVSEPSSVWLSGPAKLFTLEFFERMRAQLVPGGVVGQWLSSYDLTPEDILIVVRTFRQVFPHVALVQMLADADLLLLGSESPVRFDARALAEAASKPRVRADLERIGLNPVCGLLDRVAAEPEAVSRNLPAGPLNTDDNALLEYRGARTIGTLGERQALAVLSAGARGVGTMLDGIADRGPLSAGGLAGTCLGDGAFRAAGSLAARRLEEAPGDGDAWWVSGESLRAQGRRVESLGRFERALAAERGHLPALISTALTLQEMDRLAEAVAMWDRASAAAPDEGVVPAWRGVAKIHMGNPSGALLDFRAARALSAGRPAPVLLDLWEARALQEIGDDLGARVLLERVVAGMRADQDAGPDEVAVLERLARILSEDPATRRQAAALSSRAAELRRRLAGGILRSALGIAEGSGEGAARSFLRDVTGMDPALRPELARAAAGLPETLRGRLSSLLAGVPGD